MTSDGAWISTVRSIANADGRSAMATDRITRPATTISATIFDTSAPSKCLAPSYPGLASGLRRLHQHAQLALAIARDLQEALDHLEHLRLRLHLEQREADDGITGLRGLPSLTVTFPSEARTRAPRELATNAPVAISTPACVISSTSFPISDMCCALGGPAGVFGSGVYKLRTRIFGLLRVWIRS